jgi:Na+/H+ antiporter NhaD/arsenite permease-like protein
MEPRAFVPTAGWIVPFAALLAGIGLLPVLVPRLWATHLGKLGVAAALALPVAVLYALNDPGALAAAAADYVSFLVFLAALFVVAGGVHLDGDLPAPPAVNAAFLAVGALLASFIGTTGASMLLIRPLLQTNAERRHVTHTVVFFIFLVSNIGGCLTPLGDPPLFLGYLAGVPFAWTLRLASPWAFTVGLLLVVYFVWDSRAWARETRADRRADRLEVRPLRLTGKRNLVLLAGVVVAAAFLHAPGREFAMIALAGVSIWRTPRAVRMANRFTFEPILEVAIVFAGIFITMIPALDLLRVHAPAFGVRAPWHFFWATGLLSSFLDNAPTYLAFLAVARGLPLAPEVAGVSHDVLAAISLGAVFMGANTYIGNGPNFMVRSIAEARGVRMPTFVGYMAYTGLVLLPVFALVSVVYFRS